MSSVKDLQAQVEELKKQLEVEKQKKTTKISFKVSPKGAVSVYGLQRFPVTLYKSQWRLLLEQHNGNNSGGAKSTRGKGPCVSNKL